MPGDMMDLQLIRACKRDILSDNLILIFEPLLTNGAVLSVWRCSTQKNRNLFGPITGNITICGATNGRSQKVLSAGGSGRRAFNHRNRNHSRHQSRNRYQRPPGLCPDVASNDNPFVQRL